MVTIDGMPDSVCLTRRGSVLELGEGVKGVVDVLTSGSKSGPCANLMGKRVSGTLVNNSSPTGMRKPRMLAAEDCFATGTVAAVMWLCGRGVVQRAWMQGVLVAVRTRGKPGALIGGLGVARLRTRCRVSGAAFGSNDPPPNECEEQTGDGERGGGVERRGGEVTGRGV